MHEKFIEERQFNTDFGNFNVKIYQIPSPLSSSPKPTEDKFDWARAEIRLYCAPEGVWNRYSAIIGLPFTHTETTREEVVTYILHTVKDRILDEFSGQLRAGLMI